MKKYTLIFQVYPSNPYSESPEGSPQADTKEEARDLFKEFLRLSGNDYRRSVGEDEPVCWVHNTESWDGISYGDCDGYFLQRDGKKIVEGNY